MSTDRRVEIHRVQEIEDPGLVALVARSDAYLSALYPPESNHAVPLESLLSKDSAFFAGYIDNEVVACGGVKLLEDDVPFGEIF